MAYQTYDFKRVTCVWLGIIIDGYADGEAILAEKNEDAFTLQIGTGGEATRSKTNNNSGKITIRLQQSALTNAALSALHNLDLLAGAAPIVGPFAITDLGGTTLVACARAWIVKSSSIGFERDSKEREWMFETDDLKMFVGNS